MKFHAMQYNATLHDWKANRLQVEQLMGEIEFVGSDFVVLQEMTDTGWSMKLDRITQIGTVEWACELAKKYNCWLQVGWADCESDRGKNCVVICSPNGDPVGTYTKVFTCNPMREDEHFDCGNELLIVDLGECSVCPLICYDLRFPELWRIAAVEGVDVFTVSSSWPEKRIAHWETLLKARAIENQAYVVAANRIGKDAISLWGGNSMIVSHMGETLCSGSSSEIEIISAIIDPSLAHQWRNEFKVLDDLRQEMLGTFKVTRIKA